MSKKNSKNIKLVKYEIDQLVYKCCMNDSSMNQLHQLQLFIIQLNFNY